ncbi:hypothetical protein MBLNU459_g6496t1 [Dothideomycetes sp. NU459]
MPSDVKCDAKVRPPPQVGKARCSSCSKNKNPDRMLRDADGLMMKTCLDCKAKKHNKRMRQKAAKLAEDSKAPVEVGGKEASACQGQHIIREKCDSAEEIEKLGVYLVNWLMSEEKDNEKTGGTTAGPASCSV